jgi:hypothetical protein
MTRLDADDPPFPSESFQRLPKISAGLPNPSENDHFLSDLFQKFHWETYTYQSFTTELAG